ASIPSKSAGPGTRQNIDEFTVTTANALKEIGETKESKAIITLNPADPPILMRNTIYVRTAENAEPYKKQIIASLQSMLETVQDYVEGCRFNVGDVSGQDIATAHVVA